MSKSTSKYRNAYGEVRKWSGYDNLSPKVVSGAGEKGLCVSKTIVAIQWQTSGFGGVAILPTRDMDQEEKIAASKVTKLSLIEAHSAPLSDFALSPFNDLLMVTTSGETLKFWKLPPGGTLDMTNNIKECFKEIPVTSKRILKTEFHPLVDNMLVVATRDVSLRFLDINKDKEVINLQGDHKDVVHSITWNYTGSIMATACKDKFMRLYDPRQSKMLQQVEAQQSMKGFQAIWLGESPCILTTGFSKQGDRNFAIWDTRNLDKSLADQKVDTASAPLMPFYDPGNRLFFLAGKGDGNMKVYEHVDFAPYFTPLNEYTSTSPQSDLQIYPKRVINVNQWEIVRFAKVSKNKLDHISFYVPRKGDNFQEDLFPPVLSGEPSLTETEWLSGKEAIPKLVEMKPEGSVSIYDVDPDKKEEAINYRNRVEPSAPAMLSLKAPSSPSINTKHDEINSAERKRTFSWSSIMMPDGTSQSTQVVPETIKEEKTNDTLPGVERKYVGGIVYEGGWVNGKRHGLGRLTLSDGSSFGGTWNENHRENGVYFFSDNSSFEGTFQWDSIPSAKYTWPNGDCYEGQWKNGKRHGMGIFIHSSGATYSGKFVENMREGNGSYTFPDGSYYIGNWKADKMHGNGAFFNKGVKVEGEWENGVFISERK